MAKKLREIVKGVKASKEVPNTLGGYKPKAGDEQKFVAKHKIEKYADRAGNGDDIYNASNVKHAQDDEEESRHGYKHPEDRKVNEEKSCNMTESGNYCPIHEYADCKKEKMLKEKGIKEETEELDEVWIVTHSGGKVTKHPTQKLAMKHAREVGGKVSATHGAKGVKASVALAKTMKADKIKRPWDVKEEVEQVDEVLSKKASAGEWIKDFQKSDNPKFAGKSKEKRKQMALAAYYAKQRNEETDLEENKLYHVSWGSNREHQVVAKHADEAVSKAKAAIMKKNPKLSDKKYADAFDKKPVVSNLSYERKVQEEAEQIDEISKKVVGNYIQKASKDLKFAGWRAGAEHGKEVGQGKWGPGKPKDVDKDAGEDEKRDRDKMRKREAGLAMAGRKVAKEEVEQTDESLVQPLLGSKDVKKKKGAKEQVGPDTPMTFPGMSVDVNTGHNV